MFKLISNPKVIARKGIKPATIIPLKKLVWIPKRCIPDQLDAAPDAISAAPPSSDTDWWDAYEQQRLELLHEYR